MLSADTEFNQDNEDVESTSNVASNRRYSLFISAIAGLVAPESPVSILKRRISGSNKSSNDKTTSGRNKSTSIMRRNTTTGNEISMSVGSTVCQRCQRFEVDLTNASDSLNATDAELQASRQVISLLQRQLELFQVEKEGLEKLIISQTNKSGAECLEDIINPESDSKLDEALLELDGSATNQQSPDDTQKKLMKLIKTQLYAKDEEIVKLKANLKESQNEKEQMNLQIHTLEDELTKLRSEMSLLRENLSLRDQTIVSLSNEVFEQSNPGPQSGYARRQSSAEVHSNRSDQKQLIKLNETLEAYKKTNELLTQNVVKLTDKCGNLERKEMESKSQAQELEARCCQIQSKLLSLLKEIEQSSKANDQQGDEDTTSGSIDSEPVKQLIKRLLEDKSLDIPLSWKEGHRPRAQIKSNDLEKFECDELGFYIVSAESVDRTVAIGEKDSSPIRQRKVPQRPYLKRGISEGSFLTDLTTVDEVDVVEAGDNLKVRGDDHYFAQHSVDSLKADEATWRLYWDEFIKVFDKTNLAKSKEFKMLLRSGVPQQYRCKIWKSLIDLKVGTERRQRGPDFYLTLLESKHQSNSPKPGLNPSSKQIELDLLRTLPNNKYFEAIDSPGTVRLRKVLTAFAIYAPHIGYCQGMNRLAAVALLILPEEEAFWCLVSIVEKIMPVGYYNDLWLAQVDSNVVMDFVALKMPDLSDHLQENGIELSLFAWFLTIFVDGTPPALFLRLWDCFLYEGDKIMFRVALALLMMHESELIELNSSVAINSFLRAKINDPMDIDHFFKIAFEDINPLPGRLLRQKRENHFRAMRASMKSLRGIKDSHSPSEPVECENSIAKHEDSPYEDPSVISV